MLMVVCMRACSGPIYPMEKAASSTRLGTCMWVSGRMEPRQAMESTTQRMAPTLRAIGWKTSSMEVGWRGSSMALNTRATLCMGTKKGKGSSSGQMGVST